MTMKEKIKAVFEMYEVQSDVDSEYGEWVVSEDADVINVDKMYPIYTHQIINSTLEEWLSHLREKTWFNAQEDADFQEAYGRAKEIVK